MIPVTERPDLALVMSNIRAAHGAPGNPCPVCSAECKRKIHCNGVRGAMSVERARRIIAGYAEAAKRGEVPRSRSTGYTAGNPRPERAKDPGRAW